ncbi:MAG: hypothetical protein K0S07_463 [Chlamydiales bacterium]|jgi:ribosome-associated protein|nr:hypothetical protein [Chlamydiales bacterium]
MSFDTYQLLALIAHVIDEKKGHNIITIDVKGISSLTDYMIVAEGMNDRHLQSLCREVQDKMAERECYPIRKEVREDSGWIVLDFGDILLHLFTVELREKYRIEQVWRSGTIVSRQQLGALPAMTGAL